MPNKNTGAPVQENKADAAPIMKIAEFHQGLDDMHRGSSRYQNFIALMELSYTSWARSTARTLEHAKALEARHLAVLDKYGADRETVKQAADALFGKLRDAIAGYEGDFLGDAYAAAGFDNAACLSPFKSYKLARIAAHHQIERSAVVHAVVEGTPMLLPRDLSSSGLMVLAAADCIYSYGFDPGEVMLAKVFESDVLRMQISFMQISFKALPGMLVLYDAASGQEIERVYTFMCAVMLGYPLYPRGAWPPPAEEVAKWDAERQVQFAAVLQQEKDDETLVEVRRLQNMLRASFQLRARTGDAVSEDETLTQGSIDLSEASDLETNADESALSSEPNTPMSSFVESPGQDDLFT